jgi:cell division protein FtsB
VARRKRARRPAPGGPRSRAERRRAQAARRRRTAIVAALALSALLLAAWFPASALLHQHEALAATAAQLHDLKAQDQQLTQEQHRLNSPAEIERLARQQYKLVSPGQHAYEVLPPNSNVPASTLYPGDPARQGLADPSGASELPPSSEPSTSATTVPARGDSVTSHARPSAAPPRPGGFLHRVLQTLEFWN